MDGPLERLHAAIRVLESVQEARESELQTLRTRIAQMETMQREAARTVGELQARLAHVGAVAERERVLHSLVLSWHDRVLLLERRLAQAGK
jgi:hypothetical protein